MKEKNIISLPVYDSEARQFVGIVDVLDLVRFTALGFFEDQVFKDNLFEKFEFDIKTVGEVVEMSTRAKEIIVLKQSDTLARAMECLGTQCHRLLVEKTIHLYRSDEWTTGLVWRVLSQTDIVKYLHANLNKLGKYQENLIATPINKLHLGHPIGKEVITANNDTERAVDGFLKMFNDIINAVAIVDSTGKIRGNLSASDLRGMTSDSLKFVKKAPLEFLQAMSGHKPSEPITCTPETPLKNIMDIVLKQHVHRVWVVDEQKKPIGVVTLTDVIHAITKFVTGDQEIKSM